MLKPQTASVNAAKLYAPLANGLMADDNTALKEEVFNIAMAEVESVIKPDSVANVL